MDSTTVPQISNTLKFQRRIEQKYKIKFDDYWDFHRWSVKHYDKIWAEAFDLFEIIHSQPYTKVLEPYENVADATDWFPGVRFNFTENLLRQEEGVALIVLGEERESPEEVTFKQLIDEVATVSSALRKAGVKSGDIIACYLSARKETMICMLACGSIGAIFTAVNPLMGSEAIINRFKQVSPKVLFTIDRHLYSGEEKDVLKNLPAIIQGIPELELVIIVPSNDHSLKKDISNIHRSCFYPDFMESGLEDNGKAPKPYYEQLPYTHPFTMNFTSGTTGQPKGIIHSTGAALLGTMKEMYLSYDVRPKDVTFLIHLPGWASFNIFGSVMALRATVILYEGVPYFNKKPSYWDIIDAHKVTTAFLTPTVLEEMDKRDLVPGPHNSLRHLRTISSGSCPVQGYVYDFVFNRIKKDVFFCSIYGCTEFLGIVAGANCDLPVYKEEIQCPALGVEVLCYNESGESINDQMGEVVVVNPWPSQPIFTWKDKKFIKYSSFSTEKFPGVWWIGDMGMRNSKTGGLIVPGRCDDTIKNFGARYGSSEIYGIVNTMDEVEDSICVSRIIRTGHEVAVLFIKTKKGKDFSPEFEKSVRQKIKNELSSLHVPHFVLPVKAIPVNLNGKRMETLVKKILSGEKHLPMDSIMNAESVQEYKEYAKTTY